MNRSTRKPPLTPTEFCDAASVRIRSMMEDIPGLTDDMDSNELDHFIIRTDKWLCAHAALNDDILSLLKALIDVSCKRTATKEASK